MGHEGHLFWLVSQTCCTSSLCSLREAGLDEDCKILLFLDKCSVHPSAEMLIKNNAYARYFPQNVTSLIQPCAKVPLDQWNINIKTFSWTACWQQWTEWVWNISRKNLTWKMSYTLLKCLDLSVTKHRIMHAWYNIWPATKLRDDDQADNFE